MNEEKQKFLMREYGRLWNDAGVEGVGEWLPPLLRRRDVAARPVAVVPTRPPTLADLRSSLAARCRGCASGRPVFGAGDPKARLMFVGERPAEEEAATGVPFLGASGALLGKIIEAMGFRREQVYLTTLYKCLPSKETASCADCLPEQISAILPRVIVALGDTAAASLTGQATPVDQLRGRFHPLAGKSDIEVMVTFAPERLLAEPAVKRLVWDDMKLVMNRLQSSGRGEKTQ